MLALIMAGGQGRRLGLGEKPLVPILDRPMISYIIDAFEKAELDVIVVTAPNTSYTQNWCRAHGISLVRASGKGYVEDLVETVASLDVEGPIFTCGGDLPCITSSIIQKIRDAYERSSFDACSVWIPVSLSHSLGLEPAYVEWVDGRKASPAGINILLGEKIEDEQKELRLLIEDPVLAFNINTSRDLAAASHYLAGIYLNK